MQLQKAKGERNRLADQEVAHALGWCRCGFSEVELLRARIGVCQQ
jgi:hypothetical protein